MEASILVFHVALLRLLKSKLILVPAPIIIFDNLWQFDNVLELAKLVNFPNVIVVIFVQFWKALAPIVCAAGSDTVVRFVQR